MPMEMDTSDLSPRIGFIREGYRFTIYGADTERHDGGGELTVMREGEPGVWSIRLPSGEIRAYGDPDEVIERIREICGDRVIVPTEDEERPPVRLGPREWVAVPAGQ